MAAPRPLLLLTGLLACSEVRTELDSLSRSAETCTFQNLLPSALDGRTRVAVLVGVNTYPGLGDEAQLGGAVADVRSLADRILGAQGYHFPADNVCVLTEADATLARVSAALTALATAPPVNPDTEVLFFFAGHGVQVRDFDDEADLLDEVLALHDATPGHPGLVDDDLNRLLAAIPTEHLTIIIDACNSGSASRKAGLSPRGLALEGGPEPSPSWSIGAEPWLPDELPHAVYLGGAQDRTAALELEGHGLFTSALVAALGRPGAQGHTWGAIHRQVQAQVMRETGGAQVPTLHGPTDRLVFGLEERVRPASLRVDSVSPAQLVLTGQPMLGWGEGAILTLHPEETPSEELADHVLGRFRVVANLGIRVLAEPLDDVSSGDIEAGDIALLALPDRSSTGLRVHIDDDSFTGPWQVAAVDLRFLIEEDGGASITISDRDWQLEVSLASPTGPLVIRDPAGRTRRRVARNPHTGAALLPQGVATPAFGILQDYAGQLALLGLQGSGGDQLQDNQSLGIRLIRENGTKPACGARRLGDEIPNGIQEVPLCEHFRVEVWNRTLHPLHVGGALLLDDGTTFPLPHPLGSRGSVLLQPGFDSRESFAIKETSKLKTWFIAEPPLGPIEHVVMVGTAPGTEIDWRRVATPLRSRSADKTLSALDGALSHFLRGGRDDTRPLETQRWTVSTLAYRVVAPELPDQVQNTNHEVALSSQSLDPWRAWEVAPWLALLDAVEVLQGDDTPINHLGALPMRVFTEAGLPYGQADSALWSLDAPQANPSHLPTHFGSCTRDQPQPGDLLILEGPAPAGSTSPGVLALVLIDPGLRVAFGPLSWDPADPGRPALQRLPVDGTGTVRACWRNELLESAFARVEPLRWCRAGTCPGVGP